MPSSTSVWNTFFERFATRSIGRRRVLALLPVLGLSIAASGCIAPQGFGVYGDPYYNNSRGSYYGNGPYYTPRRNVVVRPTRVIVQRPVYQVQRNVRPAYRGNRPYVRHHETKYAPKHVVRQHDRKRTEKYIDRRGDRNQIRHRDRDRDRNREDVRTRDRDRDRDRDHRRGGRRRY